MDSTFPVRRAARLPARSAAIASVVTGALAAVLALGQPGNVTLPATQPAPREASSGARDNDAAQANRAVGGETIVDPRDRRRQFYLAPASLLARPENQWKCAGLFASSDGGKTWESLSAQFDFKVVFVHPATGELFAIIRYEWKETDEGGFLHRYFSNRVVRSADGRRWRNISGKLGHLPGAETIAADPDHAGRICLTGTIVRQGVYQSLDEDYSDWKWFRFFDWRKSHPATGPLP